MLKSRLSMETAGKPVLCAIASALYQVLHQQCGTAQDCTLVAAAVILLPNYLPPPPTWYVEVKGGSFYLNTNSNLLCCLSADFWIEWAWFHSN